MITNVELRWLRTYRYAHPVNTLQYRTATALGWSDWQDVPMVEDDGSHSEKG